MAVSDHVDLNGFIEGVKRRNPGQPEFVQAVQEVAEDIFDFIQDKEAYHKAQILRRIARTTTPSAPTRAASASTPRSPRAC
jgi:glutamate dehydrogenase (NADP+)